MFCETRHAFTSSGRRDHANEEGRSRYPDRDASARFQQRLLDRISGLGVVDSVGAVTCLPLTGCRSVAHVQREDAETGPDAIPPPAQTRGVTEGYFHAMSIPLVEGRFIERRDHEDETGGVVVSRTFAERWWPGESALGKRVYPGIVSDARAPTAFAMTLLGIAALVALLLGAVGVYGVQSYMVSQRTGEIGVRMALGASASHVSRMILRRGAAVALVGVAIGWGGAFTITGWMESMLFNVPATDPGTYVVVSITLVLVALAASYLPARRAASQDPTEALRSE